MLHSHHLEHEWRTNPSDRPASSYTTPISSPRHCLSRATACTSPEDPTVIRAILAQMEQNTLAEVSYCKRGLGNADVLCNFTQEPAALSFERGLDQQTTHITTQLDSQTKLSTTITKNFAVAKSMLSHESSGTIHWNPILCGLEIANSQWTTEDQEYIRSTTVCMPSDLRGLWSPVQRCDEPKLLCAELIYIGANCGVTMLSESIIGCSQAALR